MSDIDDELFALAGGDEDAEEGEASDVAASSPNSLGSGAMDESDSDRDEPDHDNDPSQPFKYEGMYYDEADKRRIQGMSQLDREAVLGERAEQIKEAKWAAELRIRAEAREIEAAASEKKKRKATSLEPEDSARKSSRQKTSAKNEKLEAYKRSREERGQLRKTQDDRRNRRRRSSSADKVASDVDAEGESDVDWDDQAKPAAREELPATLRDFESVRVSRGFFQKVCFYPGFEEAMVGTFARIGVGQDSMRRTLYKMVQIKGFSPGKPYVFEGKGGTKSATDQYVVAQHGSSRKEYTFSYLSNQGFSDADFETYKQSLAETNAKIPTRSFLEQKYHDIKNLENRVWTDADIGAKIERQNQYRHLLTSSSSSQNAPSRVDQTAQRLAEINKANRRTNSEQIRKALIEERHAELRARKAKERELLKKKDDEEKARLLAVDDLFGSDRSRSVTPAVRAGTPKTTQEKKGGIPTFRKRKMDDDIISSIDLGIDIEL